MYNFHTALVCSIGANRKFAMWARYKFIFLRRLAKPAKPCCDMDPNQTGLTTSGELKGVLAEGAVPAA